MKIAPGIPLAHITHRLSFSMQAHSTPRPIQPLNDPTNRAFWLRILLLASMVVGVATVGVYLLFLQWLAEGNVMQLQHAETYGTWADVFGVLSRISFFIALCAWTARMYHNLDVVGASPENYNMRVWGYFIPIANLYFGYALLKQANDLTRQALTWNGGKPEAKPATGTLLALSWLAYLLVNYVIYWFSKTEPSPDKLVSFLEWGLALEVLRTLCLTALLFAFAPLLRDEAAMVAAANQRLQQSEADFQAAWQGTQAPAAEAPQN